MVAVYQSVPRHLGTEHLSAGLPAMLGLRAGGDVRARWRHQDLASRGKRWREGQRVNRRTVFLMILAIASATATRAQLAPRPPKPIPIIVVETAKGTFAFET